MQKSASGGMESITGQFLRSIDSHHTSKATNYTRCSQPNFWPTRHPGHRLPQLDTHSMEKGSPPFLNSQDGFYYARAAKCPNTMLWSRMHPITSRKRLKECEVNKGMVAHGFLLVHIKVDTSRGRICTDGGPMKRIPWFVLLSAKA